MSNMTEGDRIIKALDAACESEDLKVGIDYNGITYTFVRDLKCFNSWRPEEEIPIVLRAILPSKYKWGGKK
jgi:hypothetical protein